MIKNKNIALGLILGSGVDLSDDIITEKNVIFEETKGVHHKLIYECKIAGADVLVFKGRKHFYEGYTSEEITSNIKTAKELGVKNLLITNAAGGLNENFCEGDFMLITSHIDFIDKLPKLPSANTYSKVLQEKFRAACRKAQVRLQEGTYGCYSGPTYETKAEIRFQKKIGLDAAGMSTVPEVNNANHYGINVIGVSIITNILKENSISVATHEDVLITAGLASKNLNNVIPAFISELN
ncbi:MAG: purine-nucleoside phosphorylase [Ignavibacteria bacterium]